MRRRFAPSKLSLYARDAVVRVTSSMAGRQFFKASFSIKVRPGSIDIYRRSTIKPVSPPPPRPTKCIDGMAYSVLFSC